MRRIAATLILALGLSGNTASAAEISRDQCNAILDAFTHLVEYSVSRAKGDEAIYSLNLDTMVEVSGHILDGDISENVKRLFLDFSNGVLANIGDDNHPHDDELIERGMNALIEVCLQ